MSVEADIRQLLALRDEIRALRERADDLEENIARSIDYGTELTVDGRRWKVYRASKREQWDHESLQRLALDTRVVSEDGEVASPLDIFRTLYTFPPSMKPSRTGIKTLGLDADEFVASEPGRLKLREVR